MQIKRHDKSYIVELEDRSEWRIWPGDIAVTLQWLPTIEAGKDWPVAEVRRSLKDG